MDFNICTASDSYKMSHWNMYPNNTTKVYSYLEARDNATYSETTFFGLQYLLKKYLVGKVVNKEDIEKAKQRVNKHFGNNYFNEEMWNYIEKYNSGYLPIRIKAVQEGLSIPKGNVLLTIENTDPKCYSLTNYLETLLLHVWSGSTVATLSRECKKILKYYLDLTSENQTHINFALHDFGARGVSSLESAAFCGAGHLVNFMGTDTFPAIDMVMDYYHSDVCAFSVAATEHSIMTSLGKEGEEQLFGQLLDKYPTGILSVVIDSYNYLDFIKMTGTKFKERILNRDGKICFRPDSGIPKDVCLKVISMLNKYFGSSQNSKGFWELNPKIGMLWGDGVGIKEIEEILQMFWNHKFSASNIVFGMGGGLLQKINRDTQSFAFKSSWQERNGIGYDIFKDPIDSTKKSKKGRLALIKTEYGYKTISEEELKKTGQKDELELVFENGRLIRDMTFNQVRENAKL